MEIRIYNNPIEVAEKFAEYLSELISAKNGPVHIALSGGSTPKLLFSHLSTNYKKIDWNQVHLYWGDERCVPPTDKESNYKMTTETLLSHIHIPSANIHRVLGENDPETEALRYSEEIKKTVPDANGLPRFDLVMLGMGDDGHTASIFPHQIELLESDKICAIGTNPQSGQKRVTITGKVINNAACVVFLVTGSSKTEKVFEVHKKEKDYKKYPASYINPSNGNLIWFMDKDAARLIS